jgi:hypothetical protein
MIILLCDRNIHPSLLPLYRGASPVQRALERGDSTVGVTVLFSVKKMDAGPILCQDSMQLKVTNIFLHSVYAVIWFMCRREMRSPQRWCDLSSKLDSRDYLHLSPWCGAKSQRSLPCREDSGPCIAVYVRFRTTSVRLRRPRSPWMKGLSRLQR